ncbi:MAG: class III poly(R)-hydroxyalkanoic acid synthase subunit PhaC [Bacteroidota bacterium]
MQPDFAPAAVRELTDLNQKLATGVRAFQGIDTADIQIGTAPKEAVWHDGRVVLYRYTPQVESPHPVPLLITYALVNRPYMVDLQENRSLVRSLLALGLDVYLIDWGYPTRADRYDTLDDHINGYLNDAVDHIREASGQDAINVLGICQGGVFSMCYASLHPEKVKNLVTMVAPVDFHIEATPEAGLLNAWSRHMDADLMADALGNVPGDLMNFGYLMLKPFTLFFQKYVEMVDVLDDERKLLNFLRMEKWIFDSPDQAGETWRAFIKQAYRDNKLMTGDFEVGDQTVDLGNLTMPVLNVYADADHLVPPASSKALAGLVGTDDYTEANFPVGHIGMYVSGKVQKTLPPLIADWLKER